MQKNRQKMKENAAVHQAAVVNAHQLPKYILSL
jgi:hypothetical protein